MSEKRIFQNALKKLESLYSDLMKGETNSEKETEIRVIIIDILSTFEATLLDHEEKNKEFLEMIEDLRNTLIDWDPYIEWFRQRKDLVDSLYQILVQAKNVVFTQKTDSQEEANRLKQELDSLKTELNDLKSLMSDLIRTKKEEGSQPTIEKTVEKEPVSSPPTQEQPPPESIKEQPTQPEVEPPKIKRPSFLSRGVKQPTSSEDIAKKVTEPSIEPTKEASPPPQQSVPPVVQETESVEQPTTESKEAEMVDTSKTIEKLEAKDDSPSAPQKVLSDMKELIVDAEKETEKEMSSFREKLSQERIVPPTVEGKTAESQVEQPTKPSEKPLTPPSVESVEPPEKQPQEPAAGKTIKQPETQEQTEPSTAEDPYMQLLTLEAEKYRLEKELERNQTAFQEGKTNKHDFDQNLQKINQSLTLVKEKIKNLRAELTK
ncbi:MAG: hypothetical protein U9O98_09105 [Asgard group archaeon]|nr:hypothetical protein [Asgard group archaeon]